MQRSHFKKSIATKLMGVLLILLGATAAIAQQTLNLSAGATSLTLPDGSVVPMWGYTCGGVSGTAQITGLSVTCSRLNSAIAGWSPIVITVPSGADLVISLTNNLSFNGNNIPTSLVIVGQLGGGLGGAPSKTQSPQHENLSTTWPIANTGPVFVPPAQPDRIQSFGTEVTGGTTSANPLVWTAPRPGTYLLESGTHPSIQVPMGLYGIVVVTTPPNGATPGTAYTTKSGNVSYNAEVPLLFSEIDPAQNNAVNTAVNTANFSESSTLGPYAQEPVAVLNLLSGGQGYTCPQSLSLAVNISGGGGTGAAGSATVDCATGSPTYGQVISLSLDNAGSGYTSAPMVTISGGGGTGASAESALKLSTSGTCSGGAAACYPPAVNYIPMYYLINGVAFDKTNPSKSLFAMSPASPASGTVLVRMVNAGSRMHVPSIVGSVTGASGASGFSLIAEDGNPLPGVARVQSEVFMAAGKTYDVMINVPTGANALPIYDRELSLSGRATNRDSGMLAYIGTSNNPAGLPVAAGVPTANPDTYNAVVPGQALTVSDISKGVIANDLNVFGVQLGATAPAHGAVTLNANGTFSYVPNGDWPGTATTDSFNYCANGTTTICATVTLNLDALTSGTITCTSPSFTASVATYLAIKTPGVLASCKDSNNLALTATNFQGPSLSSLVGDANGGFAASVPGAGPYSFTFQAQNSIGQTSSPVTVNLTFPPGSGLTVTVLDGADKKTLITDYRWIIEEDRTFFVDPSCAVSPSGCTGTITNFGTNFHTSNMPVVATGCTGPLSCESGQTQGGPNNPVVCDVGNGVCRPGNGQTPVDPSQVPLDPTKRYYISVLPGDSANPFNAGYAGPPDCSPAGVAVGSCGHGMGGAPIAKNQTAVTVYSQPSPYPPATLTVFVFEDDYPLNGEHDAGGGIDVLAPNEPGLGGFQITLQDDAGGTGDATGTPTYDMFNMPLTNHLAGTIDPATGLDACPISSQVTTNATNGDGSQQGITGMIITCPLYESDGQTLSPLAGQAMVPNLYQGRYGVVANPGADRIARGEEWLQTNTLDGQKAHDSFMRIGEPSYFQEFGPAGFHVTIGFANPKIINDRLTAMCASRSDCKYGVTGHVTTARMSRTPDERLYGSGTHDSYAFTQCYISLGDPDGAEFAFTKCADDGSFSFNNIPPGNWKITTFDQWNDQVVDGISTAIALCDTPTSTVLGTTCTYSGQNPLDLGEVAVHQWQANIYTTTFLDLNGDGVRDNNEPGLALVATNNRFRDGSFSNFNNTDLSGNAGFNEIFPLFNWYVVETDSTRFKNTGVHVVYDSGGPVDGSSPLINGTATPCLGQPVSGGAMRPCGGSNIATKLANTFEANPLPTDLRVPGARYCASADCPPGDPGFNPGSGASFDKTVTGSTGRVDPAWVVSEGWQGFSGQNNFLEFGKMPFVPGENGGIHGHVIYASTRPFDDPQLLLQLSWEPLVPHVTINLYKEGTASDGITQTLTLVDHTQTSSFDDWAQGFHLGPDGTTMVPNMSCPGQGTDSTPLADPFFWATIKDQPQWLDLYYNGASATKIPYDSQFKCYDGMHNWNQLQPAPYDGMYQFPSVTGLDATTGEPTGTNCAICVTDPDANDPYRYGGSATPVAWTAGHGAPMLPAGKYVVEVVVPPGFELVKEEDKNILIGDNFIAPVTQQFGGLGSIFILPDQAEIAAGNAAQNTTQSLGRVSSLPSHEGDTGSVETFWPCVGEARTVPDFISLYPQSLEVAPFAGATRNLCDRKEVTLDDQTSALAKFYIFTSAHIASHFTGVITDDFTAEFDPYSPQFGEKFAPAFLPVSFKDWTGNEVARVYSDQWGSYNGLNYSTWEVNPPNPTGYGPTMMIGCMNDAGPIPDPAHPGQMMTDPAFQPGYSQFCYELPFMPGQTGYFDTPVVPTSAFAGGYNNADCNYPDATPAIASVIGSDGVAGPWVQGNGSTITITALGDQLVDNYGYSGPGAISTPYNQQKITRHYSFGSTAGTVTVGGVPLTNVQWAPGSITGTVNLNGTDAKGNPVSVPQCAVTQQGQSTTYCGQLVITAANGKQSIDTVTVTIGGKKPTVLLSGQTIQSAIDQAAPGDMIIVPAGTYSEMVIMWKPVRLQGVGAASSIIDANTHPAGKLDPWRKQVVCLFGLSPNGQPASGAYGGCPASNWTYFSGGPEFPTMIVDRIPMEGILGWDTSVNGNLAEQLIEPSLIGAYEGAAITVLAKGVKIPPGSPDPYGSGANESVFPAGTVLLTSSDCGTSVDNNPYPSNFYCNPSSIDGLGLQNSSQGGGGIFVHAWAHNIQIANNRVHNNLGTLSGGITIGQGEHVDVPLVGATVIPPGSCETGNIANQALPYCYDVNVNVHNNSVTLNSSIGDELFSSTSAGAGGVSFCNGSDYYKFNYNWVCGNMSTGDGGGVSHIGFIKNGDIEHNTILFNQSTNPSITTNGGGLLVMGAPDPDPPCATNDQDCVSTPGSIPPSDGTGPGLVINANLILGNGADSGSGGGLRLQHVNGTDVLNFPNGSTACPTVGSPSCLWNSVSITNNIIANNVAGWDGGGVSLLDALAVNIVNNTIVSNNSTASSGALFNSLFAPLASSQNQSTACAQPAAGTGERSCPQPAGVVSVPNSAVFVANIQALGTPVTCPPGHGNTGTPNLCTGYSDPILYNNVITNNRSFIIGVGGFGGGFTNQQKIVQLYNAFADNTSYAFPGSLAATQSQTGACDSAESYWDIGVRGDLAPNDHSGGLLAPQYSFLSNASLYSGANNSSSTALTTTLTNLYCDGSRVPPEAGAAAGWGVPPGTNESNALPGPIFTLMPSATVDEGNNWINLRWGPLSLSSPATGAVLGNYTPSTGSPVIDAVPNTSPTYAMAPTTDFYGNPRPDVSGTQIDVGAIEVPNSASVAISVSPTALSFGNQLLYTSSAAQTVTIASKGETPLTFTLTAGGANAGDFPYTTSGTCSGSLTQNQQCTVSVQFQPNALGTRSASFTITSNDPTNPTITVTLTGFGVAPIASVSPTSLTFPATNVNSTSSAQVVTLSNTGTWALTISNIAFAGTNPGDFSQTNNCNGSVAAGSSCAISVTFKPTAEGNRSANLVVTDNSNGINGSQQTVGLTGIGLAPVIQVTPNPLAFGNVGTGGSRTLLVTIQNVGNLTLRVTSITNPSSPFSRAGNVAGGCATPPFNLNAGSSCTVNIRFSPTALTSYNGSFTITSNDPVTPTVTENLTGAGAGLTSVSPNSGYRGTSVNVTLTGSGLTGTTAVNPGANISTTSFTVQNNTTITATFAISSGASGGPRNVSVTVGGVTSNTTATFTVNTPPSPTLSSVNPSSGVRGQIVPVTLTGTNFTTAGTTVTVSGGVNVGNLTVSNVGANGLGTTINAQFTIPGSATLGPQTVRVTTPGGNSNTLTFTVGPYVSSISPSSAPRGTTVNTVTLTGSGLTGATGLTVSGTGITVSNFNAASDTSVTATFTIDNNNTTVGTHSVTVSTPAGTSNGVNFTVTQAVVSFSGPTPSLVTGTTTPHSGTITVTNTGTGPLTMTAAPKIAQNSGPIGSSFSITGGTCSSTTVLQTTAGSNTCTIVVQYSPPTTGSNSFRTQTSNATVTITDTGAATTTQSTSFNAN